MEVGRPRHRFEIGQPAFIRAIQFHRVDVRDHTALIEPPPDDALSIRREEWAAVVAGRGSEPALIGAIRVHDVDVAEVSRVSLVALAIVGGEFLERIRSAERTEHDLAAVRRVTRFRVVPLRFC